jgi:hypothetical protein
MKLWCCTPTTSTFSAVNRSINAAIGLKVPVDMIRAKCVPYVHHSRPIRRTERIVNTDFSIVAQFQPNSGVSWSTTGWRSTVTGSDI